MEGHSGQSRLVVYTWLVKFLMCASQRSLLQRQVQEKHTVQKDMGQKSSADGQQLLLHVQRVRHHPTGQTHP